MALANEAIEEVNKFKRRLKSNPLANLERYDYLSDIDKLATGNASEPIDEPRRKKTQANNNNDSSPSKDFQSYLEQYQSQIFFTLILAGTLFFFHIQKDKQAAEIARDKQQQKQLIAILLLGSLGYYFLIYLPEQEKKNKLEREKQLSSMDSKKSEEELKIEQEEDAKIKGRI